MHAAAGVQQGLVPEAHRVDAGAPVARRQARHEPAPQVARQCRQRRSAQHPRCWQPGILIILRHYDVTNIFFIVMHSYISQSLPSLMRASQV